MADLFDHGVSLGDAADDQSARNGAAFFDSELVLICFQISVWSGMQTEQTSIEEGAEYMKRRRIVPAVTLKPFLDFRARARALCQEMGEPYLNGYVMKRHDALIAERALSVWREEFCRKRDQVFAMKYQEILSERVRGVTPPGCSREAVFPPIDFVLRRITFEFDAFCLAASGRGARSSKEAFLKGLAARFVDELDSIEESANTGCVRDATISRMRSLRERMASWLDAEPLLEKAISALDEALRQSASAEVWARDRSAFCAGIRRAKGAAAEVLERPTMLSDALLKTADSEDAILPESRALSGAAGMIARGRSLFLF